MLKAIEYNFVLDAMDSKKLVNFYLISKTLRKPLSACKCKYIPNVPSRPAFKKGEIQRRKRELTVKRPDNVIAIVESDIKDFVSPCHHILHFLFWIISSLTPIYFYTF